MKKLKMISIGRAAAAGFPCAIIIIIIVRRMPEYNNMDLAQRRLKTPYLFHFLLLYVSGGGMMHHGYINCVSCEIIRGMGVPLFLFGLLFEFFPFVWLG